MVDYGALATGLQPHMHSLPVRGSSVTLEPRYGRDSFPTRSRFDCRRTALPAVRTQRRPGRPPNLSPAPQDGGPQGDTERGLEGGVTDPSTDATDTGSAAPPPPPVGGWNCQALDLPRVIHYRCLPRHQTGCLAHVPGGGRGRGTGRWGRNKGGLSIPTDQGGEALTAP